MSQLSHRQSTARLQLTNPDGTPAAGKKVLVNQTSHKFLFGCGAFDTVEKNGWGCSITARCPSTGAGTNRRKGRQPIRKQWKQQSGCGRETYR